LDEATQTVENSGLLVKGWMTKAKSQRTQTKWPLNSSWSKEETERRSERREIRKQANTKGRKTSMHCLNYYYSILTMLFFIEHVIILHYCNDVME